MLVKQENSLRIIISQHKTINHCRRKGMDTLNAFNNSRIGFKYKIKDKQNGMLNTVTVFI